MGRMPPYLSFEGMMKERVAMYARFQERARRDSRYDPARVVRAEGLRRSGREAGCVAFPSWAGLITALVTGVPPPDIA